jgi:hypothetical protein
VDNFWNVPILRFTDSAEGRAVVLEHSQAVISKVIGAVRRNQLVLVPSISFEQSGMLFQAIVNECGLGDSYDLQMKYVAHMLSGRTPIKNVAVSVNHRGAFEIIQAHSEGDTTSPLDLFGLYCVENADSGGQNILSLVNQTADHSNLRAKEKVVVGGELSRKEIAELRRGHLDAKVVLEHCPSPCRVLTDTGRGKVVVRLMPVLPAQSGITGENVVTYWDNVTVHDHAFHRHQFELLQHLGILRTDLGADYERYMHVEEYSPWAPADSDSGDVRQTSRLFSCHVVHKMNPGDFLIFHNRAWTHSVNNWPSNETRNLYAMYA